jgi:hypothetical protein
MAKEQFNIMELRKQYLHQEVRIVDGSSEDGNIGLVVSVTAGSAEPLTVLFSILSGIPRRNFYRLQDVQLTGQEWREGKERDQAVRCRQNRFDGLWYVIDGGGQHGPGAGTEGIAWNRYLHKLAAQLAGKEKHGETDQDRELASTKREDRPVAGAGNGNELQRHLEVGEGRVAPDAGECTEAEETHRA